jgi:leucyl aminopeptidase (aminopeptidase T)
MKAMWLSRGARILVDRCARVRPQERVLIVTDSLLVHIAEALAAACHDRGTDAVVAVMSPRRFDEEELPPSIAAAMAAADVVLTPTRMGTAHTEATRLALAAGARVLCMDQFDDDLMTSGGIEADFEAQQPVSCRVMEAFTAADTAHVSSAGGTDIRLSLRGRRGNSHDCVLDRPGKFTAVPNIEANVSPVDGQGDGVIVFDGSLPHFGVGILREPIRLEVERGRVVKVEGGREARILQEEWEAANDPNVYNVAQLAVGLNPMIRRVTGVMLNDHGVYGSVHFGIGTSTNLGGTTKAATHLDGIMLHASITLDGRPILRDGDLLL